MINKLPYGYKINEELSLTHEHAIASHDGFKPPLVWRDNGWKETGIGG